MFAVTCRSPVAHLSGLIVRSNLQCTRLSTVGMCTRVKNNARFLGSRQLLRARMYPQNRYRGSLQVMMVLTESMELEIGTIAPNFELLEPLTGKTVKLSEFESSRALLVMFICNHCPFVKMLKEPLAKLAAEYQQKGVGVVAISSNSIQTHPQDGPQDMAKDATAFGYKFPYLYDEDQSVAKVYKAACTPEFYLFDAGMRLCYHGQFDDARPKNGVTPTGDDLRAALDAVLEERPIQRMKPSIGCNIKWHPGREPAYFGASA